jgi:transcriptional regulator of heat shock response
VLIDLSLWHVERLDTRKSGLLKLVIQRHTETAEPIGSSWLSEQLGVSSATIRNEMCELERMELLTQPHTSAGRIPTEAGYKYYIRHFLKPIKPSSEISEVMNGSNDMKTLAKAMAEFAQQTVLVGFGPRDVYYTGISNLFSKPEFRAASYVTTMSKVLDHLDEVMERVWNEVEDDIQVRVGTENPFGTGCSVIMTRTPKGLIALLGPMRMDYDSCHGLLKEAVKTLSEEKTYV